MLLRTLVLIVFFTVSYSLPTLVRNTGEWAACKGRTGVCTDVNRYTCSTATLTGKCPGPSNIRCCPYPGGVDRSACKAISGVCTRTANCRGSFVTRKCPGPSGVTCCRSSTKCTLGTTNKCETSVASGLTEQLVKELNSMGISFAKLSDKSKFHCSGSCQPYLQTKARNALSSATSAAGDHITLNSAYRSSAQQYLLYRWYRKGQCKENNIELAAKPGTSNHESGLAIDTTYYDYWEPRLKPYGWKWLGNKDKVHFDYKSGGNLNVRRESLRAFQRLWNRNNPNDQIATDGKYGSATARRLTNAPCDGW